MMRAGWEGVERHQGGCEPAHRRRQMRVTGCGLMRADAEDRADASNLREQWRAGGQEGHAGGSKKGQTTNVCQRAITQQKGLVGLVEL